MKRCVLAKGGVHVRPDGDIVMCCDQKSLGLNASNIGLLEAFNSEKFKQVRQNLADDIQDPSCSVCWNLENKGLGSSRTRFSSMHTDSDNLSHWDIRDDNLCNMSCRMCGPWCSSLWNQEALKYKDDKTYYNHPVSDSIILKTKTDTKQVFQDNLDHCKSVYFAGGEPLLNNTHWDILKILYDNERWDTHVRYTTNLMKTKYKGMDAIEMWKKFKRISISVSVDAIGELAEYTRTGTVWETVEENLRKILQYQSDEINVNVNITTSLLTIHQLDKTIDYLLDLGVNAEDIMYFNVLRAPRFLNVNLLPTEEKHRLWTKLNLERFNLNPEHGLLHLKNLLFEEPKDKQDNIFTFRSFNESLDRVRNTDLKQINYELWKCMYETD